MLKIHEITLLSVQDYSRCEEYIPPIKESWWLRSPAVDGGQLCVSFLNGHRVIGVPRACSRYIRPAMRITGMDVKPGDKIAIFAESWTVLQSDETILVLCDRCLSYSEFDSQNREYETSNVYRWLNRYLSRRLKANNLKQHRRLSRMNRVRLSYLENPFWCEWVGPLCISLPICLFLIAMAKQLSAIALPNVLRSATFGIAMTCAVIGFLRTVFVLASPHKDTGFRHLLNVGMLAFLIATCWTPVSPMAIACVSVATIIYCINYRYLTAIKYYS